MENNEGDRKLDQWLDEALSEYSAAEPRFGLEQRVLNRVRGEQHSGARRSRLGKWIPVFAAIALGAIIGAAIRPMAFQKAHRAQDSAAVAQRESPQRSEVEAVAPAAGSGEAGPAKKALAHKEAGVGEPGGDAREPVTGGSDTRAAAAASAIRDAREASGGHAMDGPEETIVPPILPPQPSPSGGNRLAGTVNQPSSEEMIPKDGAASPTGEGSTVPGAVAADRAVHPVDEGKIPLPGVPTLAPAAPAASTSAPTGIIGVETVAVAKETAALKRMKTKKREREQAAKVAAGDANVMDVFGMRLRTDVRQAPAGPMQFPTPAPLSAQEKLVLAATKTIKDVPAQLDAQGGAIPAVEIKEVEIKPLEGPRK